MDEIKFNLNKLPEFPKSIRNGGTQDIPLGEEEKKSIIKFMKAADQANTGNKDGLISSSELILYGTNNRSPESWQSSLVFNEWSKGGAQSEPLKPSDPPKKEKILTYRDIQEFVNEARRVQAEPLEPSDPHKFAGDFATAVKDQAIKIVVSGGDYYSTIGRIGTYDFKYEPSVNNNIVKAPSELILTDPNNKKIKLQNLEQFEELKPFLERLKSEIKKDSSSR
jgi:hypothetical protein